MGFVLHQHAQLDSTVSQKQAIAVHSRPSPTRLTLLLHAAGMVHGASTLAWRRLAAASAAASARCDA